VQHYVCGDRGDPKGDVAHREAAKVSVQPNA
jgi:hypothetical protein